MIKVNFNKNTQKGLISGESDYIKEIREHFSIPNPDKKHSKSKFISSRFYNITPTGIFDIGLWDDINKYIVEKQFPTDLEVSPEFQYAHKPKLFDNFVENLSLPLRYYQKETVELCIEHGRGIALLATSAGKTLTICSLIENYFLNAKDKSTWKCLLIVPDLGLVEQTFKDFNDYNPTFKYSKWTGSQEYDISANCIIVNAGILHRQYEDHPWVNYSDLLIIDEAHKVGHDAKLGKIINKIKTFNKFGFTGTLPENIRDRWSVIGKIGNVLIKKTSYDLRQEGYVANVGVKCLKIAYKDMPDYPIVWEHPTDKLKAEIKFIQDHPFRNKLIKTICNNFKENVLILVNRREHGQILYDFLKTVLLDKKVEYVNGDVEVEDRETIKQIMRDNNNVICVAMSSVFSVGISINNIHMIVFAAGGKAFIRTVQSIGRGLRLHERKKMLYIIDIIDCLEYGIEHALKRQKIYSEEKIQFTNTFVEEK